MSNTKQAFLLTLPILVLNLMIVCCSAKKPSHGAVYQDKNKNIYIETRPRFETAPTPESCYKHWPCMSNCEPGNPNPIYARWRAECPKGIPSGSCLKWDGTGYNLKTPCPWDK